MLLEDQEFMEGVIIWVLVAVWWPSFFGGKNSESYKHEKIIGFF